MSRAAKIKALACAIPGLANDARYWDLRRTCGDDSREVLSHLESCAKYQRAQVQS